MAALTSVTKMADDKVDHVELGQTTSVGSEAAQDKAAEVLHQSDTSVILTPENNKRILRKVDLFVLPVILGIYFLQALDKVSRVSSRQKASIVMSKGNPGIR